LETGCGGGVKKIKEEEKEKVGGWVTPGTGRERKEAGLIIYLFRGEDMGEGMPAKNSEGGKSQFLKPRWYRKEGRPE